MHVFFDSLQYVSIRYGFIALMFAGFTFPIVGCYIIRLNLLTFRFLLVHGAMLGGVLASILGINSWVSMLGVMFLIIIIINLYTQELSINLGQISLAFTIMLIGLTFLLIYKFNIPFLDILSYLWGNIYAINKTDLIFIIIISISNICFLVFFYDKIKAVLFDMSLAITTGISTVWITLNLMSIIGITVIFSMKLIGILLVDSLLILPAVVSFMISRSFFESIIKSSCIGGILAFFSFVLSVYWDVPMSVSLSVLASLLFAGIMIVKKLKGA